MVSSPPGLLLLFWAAIFIAAPLRPYILFRYILVSCEPLDVSLSPLQLLWGPPCCWPSTAVAPAVAVVSAVAVCLTVVGLAAVGVALHEALLVGENNKHVCFEHR